MGLNARRLLALAGLAVLGGVVSIVVIGCALVMHGSTQRITLNSSPAGATVTAVTQEGTLTTTAPGVLTISRKNSNVQLIFEKEGYRPVEVSLTRSTDGWVWGNILIGGLIGLAVDFSTGAAYKLSPERVDTILEEEHSSRDNSSGALTIVMDVKAGE